MFLSSFLFSVGRPAQNARRAAGRQRRRPRSLHPVTLTFAPFKVSTRTPARRIDPPCAAANRRRPPFVFVISSVASFQCPLPSPEGSVLQRWRLFPVPPNPPRRGFRGGNRRSPFAVAKVPPFFPTNQIFSQLFSKKIYTK